jgi:hypothetical protein
MDYFALLLAVSSSTQATCMLLNSLKNVKPNKWAADNAGLFRETILIRFVKKKGVRGISFFNFSIYSTCRSYVNNSLIQSRHEAFSTPLRHQRDGVLFSYPAASHACPSEVEDDVWISHVQMRRQVWMARVGSPRIRSGAKGSLYAMKPAWLPRRQNGKCVGKLVPNDNYISKLKVDFEGAVFLMMENNSISNRWGI